MGFIRVSGYLVVRGSERAYESIKVPRKRYYSLAFAWQWAVPSRLSAFVRTARQWTARAISSRSHSSRHSVCSSPPQLVPHSRRSSVSCCAGLRGLGSARRRRHRRSGCSRCQRGGATRRRASPVPPPIESRCARCSGIFPIASALCPDRLRLQ